MECLQDYKKCRKKERTKEIKGKIIYDKENE